MTFPAIKPHYRSFSVEIVTQQAPNKVSVIQVPARSAKDAVEAAVVNPEGRYDWVSISCANKTVERPPHRGGPR
jgi:hypothetical protein